MFNLSRHCKKSRNVWKNTNSNRRGKWHARFGIWIDRNVILTFHFKISAFVHTKKKSRVQFKTRLPNHSHERIERNRTWASSINKKYVCGWQEARQTLNEHFQKETNNNNENNFKWMWLVTTNLRDKFKFFDWDSVETTKWIWFGLESIYV